LRERSPKSYIFLILIVVLVLGAIGGAFFLLRTNSMDERVKKGEIITILFTINDNDKVLLIEPFFYNPATKKAVVLYLPQSLWLMLEPLNRYDMIEKLYSRGNPKPLMEKIERALDVKIPYYIDIDLAKSKEVIDLLGGIEVFIPNAVNKREGGRMFLFESGSVVLDGDKAADFLSLELESDTDLEKAQRRQDFLKALLFSMIESAGKGFLGQGEPLSFLYGRCATNLSKQELETFIVTLQNLNSKGVLYRRPYGTLRKQDNQQIFIPNDQGEQLKQTMKKAVEFLKDTEKLRPEDLVVTLEVLNGTDIPFRARDTAAIYRNNGYEVAKEENAQEKSVPKTVIIDRKGNPKIAQEIAAVIKCKNIKAETDTDTKTNAQVDFTIIIGKDFDGQYCK
jgi:LCP family protein required for cell wall assembly